MWTRPIRPNAIHHIAGTCLHQRPADGIAGAGRIDDNRRKGGVVFWLRLPGKRDDFLWPARELFQNGPCQFTVRHQPVSSQKAAFQRRPPQPGPRCLITDLKPPATKEPMRPRMAAGNKGSGPDCNQNAILRPKRPLDRSNTVVRDAQVREGQSRGQGVRLGLPQNPGQSDMGKAASQMGRVQPGVRQRDPQSGQHVCDRAVGVCGVVRGSADSIGHVRAGRGLNRDPASGAATIHANDQGGFVFHHKIPLQYQFKNVKTIYKPTTTRDTHNQPISDVFWRRKKFLDKWYYLGILATTRGDSTLPQPHIASGADQPIDLRPLEGALDDMLKSQLDAASSVRAAFQAISNAAKTVTQAIEAGATVHYAAAGSSGLMALADACELPGTFGVPQNQIRISMAGGVPVDGRMPGDTEDSQDDALQAAHDLRPGDVAIVVSASGTTPYALSFANAARAAGARCIAIANVPGSPLLSCADVAIALHTGPEVVSGSTRLGAGTAQKLALNMMSTQVGILLGHVHDGMMINLRPENIKLRRRATDIVARIADVDQAQAAAALEVAGYEVKLATLLATGLTVDDARARLERHRGRLRPCLQETQV